MRFFKPIPDEGDCGDKPHFIKRKIRKTGDLSLIKTVRDLLEKFEDEGDEMLVSELGDLVEALHRSAILVQNSKQKKMLAKLRKHSRQKFFVKKRLSS
ncbi:hypothetical protein K9N08_00825 [Candidatus Gracilibacteria bacterium]|nr:hypothetical protein [Candidatus Gracilibacteria bacterium]MCF7856087.1 hypothetical protein [Candidatus Gracilibacteria bacterium]MCF7896506.1 hypothetical protein [Candidatus Gracilibacteria bacterium]